MDLVAEVKGGLDKQSLSNISQHLVVPEATVEQGAALLVPLTLAALLKKGNEVYALGDLSSVFTGNPQSIENYRSAEVIADSPAMLHQGRILLQELLGVFTVDVNRNLYETFGLNPTQSMGFLTLVMPLIMHRVDQLIVLNNWSIPQFYKVLFAEKERLSFALPMELKPKLGLEEIKLAPFSKAAMANSTTFQGHAPSSTIDKDREGYNRMERKETSKGAQVLKWVVILAIVLIIFWALWSRGVFITP